MHLLVVPRLNWNASTAACRAQLFGGLAGMKTPSSILLLAIFATLAFLVKVSQKPAPLGPLNTKSSSH